MRVSFVQAVSPHFIAGAVGFIGYDVIRFFEPTVPVHPQRRSANAGDDVHDRAADGYFRSSAAQDSGRLERADVERRMSRLRKLTRRRAKSWNSPRSNESRSAGHACRRFPAEKVAKASGPEEQHDPRANSKPVSTGQGVHPRRRHLPVRAVAALRDGLHRRPAHALPRAAFRESVALHVSAEIRRDFAARRQLARRSTSAACIGRGNPPHRRHAPAGPERRRGRRNAPELLADPKERAEHLMLVDLARNDVGRVAEFGSVKVSDFMTIEQYSHVMHIVSNVHGSLRPDRTAYDVMRATFPAGTVSGSPKVRAMQIINQFEKSKRGVYAGRRRLLRLRRQQRLLHRPAHRRAEGRQSLRASRRRHRRRFLARVASIRNA